MNEAAISAYEQGVRGEMERRVEQWLENKYEAAAKIAFLKRSTAMKLVAARRRVIRGMQADAVRRELALIETAQALMHRPRWEALPLARVVLTERHHGPVNAVGTDVTMRPRTDCTAPSL